MIVSQKLSQLCFRLVHRNNLVYNTCWEDPRLDRIALQVGPADRIVTITSAGCNVLDYALLAPAHIHAVDLNPRQNALLELKRAAIRQLDYDTFFEMFGRGRLPDTRQVYFDALRPELPEAARAYWDRRIRFFAGDRPRRSFYFRGTAGYFARNVNRYLDRVARVRDALESILEARNLDEQQDIYDRRLRGAVWTRLISSLIRRDFVLSLLGVPRPQREQVERAYAGGISQFIQDSVETVFTRLPLHDNYFWRVYLTGQYTPGCCPEYLKRGNFEKLKGGLVERISTHTGSLVDFLQGHHGQISRFVLLDHMDWLAAHRNDILQDEWQAILDRAAPGARVLWRSGGLSSDFVDELPVHRSGTFCRVEDVLQYNRDLATNLHERDRVHTYGSFFIAHITNS